MNENKLEGALCLKGLEEKGSFPINRLNANGLRVGAMANNPAELARMYCYESLKLDSILENTNSKEFLVELKKNSPEFAKALEEAKKPFDFMHAFHQDKQIKDSPKDQMTEVEMLTKLLSQDKSPLTSICDHCKSVVTKIVQNMPDSFDQQ